MTIGDRIRKRREELHLTQSELAKRMGYSDKSAVCKAETCGDNIQTRKIEKFANALGVSISYLMGWEEPKADTKNAAELLHKHPELFSDAFIMKYADMSEALKAQVRQYADFITKE